MPLLTVTLEIQHKDDEHEVADVKYTCTHATEGSFDKTARNVPLDTVEHFVTLITRMHKDLLNKYPDA